MSAKSVLAHPEPRCIRDRDHVRFVAQQTFLVCGRQPCDAHHLRFSQDHGDETAWWQKIGLDPTTAARALWLQTHPLGREQIGRSHLR
jgi:hypothetical protein